MRAFEKLDARIFTLEYCEKLLRQDPEGVNRIMRLAFRNKGVRSDKGENHPYKTRRKRDENSNRNHTA